MTDVNRPPKLLTVNQVCEYLDTNKYEVYRLIHSGALTAVLNRPGGGRYRISQAAVDEYLDRQYSTPAMPTQERALRTVADVAAQLNCSQETVRRLVADGHLEATRFAGKTSRLRISPEAVDAYISRHQAKPSDAEEKTA